MVTWLPATSQMPELSDALEYTTSAPLVEVAMPTRETVVSFTVFVPMVDIEMLCVTFLATEPGVLLFVLVPSPSLPDEASPQHFRSFVPTNAHVYPLPADIAVAPAMLATAMGLEESSVTLGRPP